MLALNAPGQLSYDSVEQLANGRSGFYNSWHPPVMAWLLGLFDAVVPGTLLFLIFQSLLLLGALLVLLRLRPRDGRTALVALVIVLTPQWLLFQGQIWKDILFADAAIAGFAALGGFCAKWTKSAGSSCRQLLLALAAAVRQNAIILLPVAALVVAHAAPRKRWLLGLGFLAVTVTLGIGTSLWLVARADGGDGASAQVRLGQAYDLAGALSRDPKLPLPSLAAEDPAFEKLLRQRGPALYTPLRNDPFAADPAINHGLSDAPTAPLGRAWKGVGDRPPLLYFRTRAAAFGAVLATPDALACHFTHAGIDGPPTLLRQLGLVARIRPQDRALVGYARLFFATPVYSPSPGAWWRFWPWACCCGGARRGIWPLRACWRAALLFTLTFALISIACDYRYPILLDLAAMAESAAPGNGPRKV